MTQRLVFVVAVLIGCGGDDRGSDDDTTPTDVIDFIPATGFYQLSYDWPWDQGTCAGAVYAPEKVGAMVRVLATGDDFSIMQDYYSWSMGCLVDLTDGSFECGPDKVTYDWEEEYELDAFPSFLYQLTGQWTDAKTFTATQTIDLDCEGSWCNRVPDTVPPYTYDNEGISFPCQINTTATSVWIQEDPL